MTHWTIQPLTHGSLEDAVALLPDPADAARRLQIMRDNIAAGRLRPEQFQVLRSARGLEGVCLLPTPPPPIPLLPRLRADVPPDAAEAFLAHLLTQVRAAPQRRLILDSTLAPSCREAAQAAGWTLSEEAVMYSTDLQARAWPTDPQAQPFGPEAWATSEVQGLLAVLGRADLTLQEGWRLVGLRGTDGQLAALGATGPGGRPGLSGIDLIGVHPGARGQGLGRRLHAHLLALAAQAFPKHIGGTDAGNQPMRRIFEEHGGVLTQQQLIFVRP